MSNSRFGYNNLLTNPATPWSIANGDGTGPVRSEVGDQIMERAADGERSTLWQPGAANQSGGAAWEIVFDFGGNVSFTMMAARGVEGVGVCNAGVYSTYASAKNQSSLIRNGRDFGATFTQKTGRYPFFTFSGGTPTSIGDLFIGTHFDAGVVGLPDYQSTPFRIRTEQAQMDGSTVLNDTGRLGHNFDMSFFAKDVTAVTNFENLISTPGTVIHIDERDRTFEVVIRNGELQTTRRRGARIVTLSMQRQP